MSEILNNLPEDVRSQISNEILEESKNTVKQPTETKAEDLDISNIAEAVLSDPSASYSSVLGNLDDEDDFYNSSNVDTFVSETTNSEPEISFDDDKVEEKDPFDEESNVISSDLDDVVKSAFKPEIVEKAEKEIKEEGKYYKSYKDNAIIKGSSNPKLEFVDKIVVDLNNITITEKPAISQIDDMNLVFDTTKSSFMVVCCQSGYQASLVGLTLAEKNAINNSNLDMFESRKLLYKTVYNKIHSMNFKKPEFDEWLKITSFGDWNTLLFGIYCQTFIDDNDFDITCGKCRKVTPVTVNNQSLIEVRDKEVYEKIDEIISHVKSPEELIAISTVHKNERIMLPDSKIVIDIHTPTLYEHLQLLSQSNPSTLQQYADTFSAMLFIKNLFMIDAKKSYTTGVPNYYPVTSKPRILDILLKLSNNDGELLENAIESKLGKYQLEYRIHNVSCIHCQAKLPEIPLDIESILFTRINRVRKDSK